MAKFIPANVNDAAFNCPHCGVLTTQVWHETRSKALRAGKIPSVWTALEAEEASPPEDLKVEQQSAIKDHWRKLATGDIFNMGSHESEYSTQVANLNISKCFNCDRFSVWLHDRLAWPAQTAAPPPSDDMPSEVKNDYIEAAEIASASPRGAAALLRLAIQRLCAELGGSGRNINDDIAKLVKEGLDSRVQKALDVVRVVGNNAVHPGELDLSDDRSTVDQMFTLINLIVEIMITQPGHVARMYDALPVGALEAIERRDSRRERFKPTT
ncbi:DUF4145 domain-containing protein [Sphingomonas sp. Leaf205]|uniref:DUF4145 domain-containing protein n=1 Tax=Sphingomonas sp. Leaf205 TaxID=2876551 RepID=UPI001E61E777|nr:DUF4145 domain-containing protein [Sphingomonas sp. Leaf205]